MPSNMERYPKGLPDTVKKRLDQLQHEIDRIISAAESALTTSLPGPVAFTFENMAARDVLTAEERAQSVSFITRFEHLLADLTVKIEQLRGKYYIANMGLLRHALNEFRPVIQNESDSVYYQKIHNVWYRMLTLGDPRKGTTIRVVDKQHSDVTKTYFQWLSEHNKAITSALRPLDYKYLYNGILQHSDPAYSERFLRDYTSGELNYVVWKHVLVLNFIRAMLEPYYILMKFLTSPRLGALNENDP